MPACCHLSRRQFLKWAAIVGASPILSALPDQEWAYGASPGLAVPMNLELVTLTETSAIVTWFTGDPTRPDHVGRPAPVPADTEVLLGTSPASLRTVLHTTTPTPYHYAELTALEPGQTYFYVARSAGVDALPAAFALGNPVGTSTLHASVSGPFLFTTPQPPPGRHLFSIALCNDMHVGESVAGLISSVAGGVPPGISQVPGEPPYTQVMGDALGPEARARGAELLLAAGDITSEAGARDLAHARAYLDAFGAYRSDYLVTRGNHDRPHHGAAYSHCPPVPFAPGYYDCFREAFFPSGRTWFATEHHGLRVVGLDTYNKIGGGADNGVLGAEPFGFLRETLASDKDRPTLVFGHHPVSLEASLTTTEPLLFDLNQTEARQVEQLYAGTPGVFLHHSGHTHRNKRTVSSTAPGVLFQEVASVKEYPGGFHLLRVFTGGYALNFYKFRSPLAREWSERTRQEDFGGYPYYAAGNVADRNAVVVRDLSGLVAVPSSTALTTVPPPSTTSGPSRPPLPVTGADPTLPIAGTAALAAAAAAETWLRHNRSSRVEG
ncbi:MAG: metallophosphoesterase family protein [Acidimicrobiales bacterium]